MPEIVKEYGVVEYPDHWIIVVRAGTIQAVYLASKHHPTALDTLLEGLLTGGFIEVGWKEAEPTST